jgi:hypothetical protein
MAHNALHYRYNPLHQDIICSETAIATLPATVDALGASRAMITCGPTILSACNVVPRVQEALGYRKRSRGKLIENQWVNFLGFAHRLY